MATDDVRISAWDLRASAGTTVSLEFTSSEALTSLAVYTGGTTADVDDLTDATAHTAALSGGNLVATVEVDVPTGSSVPLRLVVDGAVQSVGRLIPSTSGTSSPDNTITLTPGSFAFDLTVLGIVVNEGGGEGGTDDQTATEVAFTPTGTIAATDVQAAIAEVSGDVTAEATTRAAADSALSDLIATEQTTRAAADTALDGRLDTVEATLPAKADLVDGVVPDGQLPAGLTRDDELAAYVSAAIDGLLDGAPGALDTLNELAAAIGDDADFAATVTAALAGKQAAAAELTVLSGLSSTALGRTLLTIASAAAARSAIDVYSTTEVDDAIASGTSTKANDADVVHDTGDETVAGVKTFTSSPIVPTPTTDFQAATKKYVDDNAGGGGAADGNGGSGTATGWYYEPTVGALANLAMTLNRGFYVPFLFAETVTLDRIAVNVQTAGASSTVRLGIYADSNGLPGSLVLDAGTVDSSTTGEKAVTISQSVDAGWYWLVAVAQGSNAPSLRGSGGSPAKVPTDRVTATSLVACLQSNLGAISGALPSTADVSGTPAFSTKPNIAVRIA